jgi:hypothetical protein
VQAIVEGSARARLGRADNTRTTASAETLNLQVGEEIDFFRQPGSKDTSGWYGYVGPAGLPKPIVARLNEALVKTLATPEVRDRFASQGIDGIASTPAAFAAFLREETAKWRKVIDASGLKGD